MLLGIYFVIRQRKAWKNITQRSAWRMKTGIKSQIVLVIWESLSSRHLAPWWVEMGNVIVRILSGVDQNIQKKVAGAVAH